MTDRRERLAALASRAGRSQQQQQQPQQSNKTKDEKEKDDDNNPNHSSSNNVEFPNHHSIHFRNYTPKDGTLTANNTFTMNQDYDKDENDNGVTTTNNNNNYNNNNNKKRKMMTNDGRNNTMDDNDETTKTALEKALLEAKVDAAVVTRESTVTGVAAPKKVNWDLKRDIGKKLNRLERRTQRAIVDLLRERLEKEALEDVGVDDYEEEELD
mmetsp:Transcript_22534/g.31784  ORF Transcript_22534/g.31784 Transcript_22534/m.31784 type:complete len:212 (+) Transcript_22534:39-674(+)|eukprot:CAMPEP_0184858518 /NCGR_PEP_ID=MMETSP0580-20130426/3604_1 /TAXON_ID=1118495 /ORGANISM="Dactyliosolen fragilissimus" /LENGTH=211 /DNA_ID=CAMNT_0027354691 /DNA_START=23 /DNA_END=658 /DNA_ORIENTATION=+